jgi:site-specific DNA recombinase
MQKKVFVKGQGHRDPLKPRAFGYIRVSAPHLLQGTSPENQATQIQTYAKLKGFELTQTVTEKPMTASIPFNLRPFGRLIEKDIQEKKFDAFIVHALDRAFRDTEDCLRCQREWEACGVGLHIVNLGGNAIDTSTPSGKFVLTILAGAAVFERETTRARMESGRQIRFKQLRGCGLNSPYGWKFGEIQQGYGRPYKPLLPVPEEQHILNIMLDLDEQGHSNYEVSKRLNQMGFVRRNGRDWTQRAVKIIMYHARRRGVEHLGDY